MIFGHKLFFQDEVFFNVTMEDCNQNLPLVVTVVEDKASYGFYFFLLKSEKVVLSGQDAYYYSQKPFEEVDKKSLWALEIKDVLFLVWDSIKQQIVYRKGPLYTTERLRYWIYHTFFPLVLELKNTYHMLHVGAVEVEGMPILFSAFSFGGKSTLTNYFLKHGHRLFSDDSLALEEKDDLFYAVPSYPYHRPYRKVETLGYYAKNFARESKPIHVVYTLKKSDAKDDVVITELKGIEKFKALHKSIFIDFDFMKKKHFEFLTKMAEGIPIYEITVPWDMQRLEEVYKAICTHTNSLN